MPLSRLFWKLLLTFAGVNFLAAIVFGLVLSNWQQQRIIEQSDLRLRNSAVLVRDDVAELMQAGRSQELQRRIRKLGELTSIRFTVVAVDGKVLADSGKLSADEVAAMDNHRHRPEIMRAIADQEGAVVRTSATMELAYRYFALRVEPDGGPALGVVRAAIPSSRIQSQMAAARRVIWGLVGGVFLAALGLAYAIIAHVLRPIPALAEAAETIAAGDYDNRMYVDRRDELGQLARTFNRMSQDLHARMTQLSETSTRQSTVLGGMVEGVIAVDERERIVLANKAAGRLFDFRPAAVEGRPLLEVLRNHAVHQAVNVALITRRPGRLETKYEATGKLIADVHVTPLPGDPCPGVVLVMHDTTELRRLESVRREFVANVSHELKTPLSSIKAYAETLRNGALADPEAGQKFLQRIEEQADRLHRLILDMLMIARIESDQRAFEIVSVDVAEVAAACLDDHRPAADAKNINLLVEPDQPPCSVRADREALREILDNLVDNAVKYTPDGGRVSVRWSMDAGLCRIAVHDTGIGIGPEHRKRVFERFYRVDKARSREMGGTGLGLSIVKHLAQSFGGKVSVQSEPGRGSTFTVELPLA
jgi:two-component system, OmpR family, phosphate regulon sensor histidine kinase PhoR